MDSSLPATREIQAPVSPSIRALGGGSDRRQQCGVAEVELGVIAEAKRERLPETVNIRCLQGKVSQTDSSKKWPPERPSHRAKLL